jgi:hypothetical protein
MGPRHQPDNQGFGSASTKKVFSFIFIKFEYFGLLNRPIDEESKKFEYFGRLIRVLSVYPARLSKLIPRFPCSPRAQGR